MKFFGTDFICLSIILYYSIVLLLYYSIVFFLTIYANVINFRFTIFFFINFYFFPIVSRSKFEDTIINRYLI